MKKLIHIGFILLTCILLHACTSDDLLVSYNNSSKKLSGKCYMNVHINMLDSSSTRGEDGGYADGTDFIYSTSIQHEAGIYCAKFYFYNTDGNIICVKEISHDDWVGEDEEKTDDTGNIEYYSNQVLVLDSLDATPPIYMVTIINPRASFKTPATLEEMSQATINNAYNAPNNVWYYTASTTSYKNGQQYPFVTELTASDFYSSTNDAEEAEPIEIYAERVAAKLTCTRDIDRDVDAQYSDGSYKVDCYKMSDVEIIGAESCDVYVGLYGWRVNAYSPYAKAVKSINNWTDEDLGFSWNDPVRHRSYWTKGYLYDADVVYPDHYYDGVDMDLTYISYGNMKNSKITISYTRFDDDYRTASSVPYMCVYRNEHTTTSEVATKYYPNATTCITIPARILLKPKDESYLYYKTLVRFKGQLYTEDAFKKMVFDDLNSIGAFDNLRNGTHTFDEQRLKIDSDPYLNGHVRVVAYEDLFDSLKDADGNDVDFSVLNDILATYTADSPAQGYYHGCMYYTRPIEHFNTAEIERDKNYNITKVPEGKYGIVRNHWYQFTVKAIDHIGEGVWDPTEPIIPNPEDESIWRIKATCKVMPWKMESQTINFNKKTK